MSKALAPTRRLDTVTRYFADGLAAGDRIFLIATRANRDELARRLRPAGIFPAIGNGQVVFLDAQETLSRFMVGGMPDPDLFRETIEELIAQPDGRGSLATARIYGEMVDLLWRAGNSAGAVRLEEMWSELVDTLARRAHG